MALHRFEHAVRRSLWARKLRVFHHPHYRLPIVGLESNQGIEPRRSDLVRWYLLDEGVLTDAQFELAQAIGFPELARVHTPEYLESLSQPETLARIFASEREDFPVDEVLHTVRLACGATLQAARWALRERGHALNLLGGFHHAAPDHGGGLCAVNDIAVAIAALRAGGFTGNVAILDLDAHPPDGLSACLLREENVWIGSLSGSDWGRMPNVRETLLPPGTRDAEYLRALRKVLSALPLGALCFVIAGGDVLAHDRMGRLAVTTEGAQKRDWLVFNRLRATPTVWVPGGGYHRSSWRVLANTVRVLALHTTRGLPHDYDPIHSRFAYVSSQIHADELRGDEILSSADVDELFGGGRSRRKRILGYYTQQGIEYGLFRYGILSHVERLGYTNLRITLDDSGSGDRMRVLGTHAGREHVLIESVVEKRVLDEKPVLFVNWLELMHPIASFSASRPRLPGQKHPGLGLSNEATELLGQIAKRLGLKGVVFRPAYFHVARGARHLFVFADARRQGRFLAMLRDLRDIPVDEATRACAEGRVMLCGEPYAWEATEMVRWLDGPPAPDVETRAEMERCRFTIL